MLPSLKQNTDINGFCDILNLSIYNLGNYFLDEYFLWHMFCKISYRLFDKTLMKMLSLQTKIASVNFIFIWHVFYILWNIHIRIEKCIRSYKCLLIQLYVLYNIALSFSWSLKQLAKNIKFSRQLVASMAS